MDVDDRTADDAGVLAEARAWFDSNWSPELTLGEWWDRLGRSGWGFPAWPREWFGRGLRSATARAVLAERSRRGIFGPPSGISTFLAAPTILAYGTEEQKQRYLPGIATGRDVWCQLFSEPEAGSDMASLQTRAVRDGDEWVVNGQKVWTSGAHYSHWGLLLARTDVDVPKHRGITAFAIDMRSAGIDIRPLRQITGAAHFNEVFLTDVRIPDAHRIGGLEDGWRVANTMLANERSFIGGGGRVGFGDLVELARAHGADGIVTSAGTDPRVAAICEVLEQELPVEVLEPQPFVELDEPADLGRFSRYWRRAEREVWAAWGEG